MASDETQYMGPHDAAFLESVSFLLRDVKLSLEGDDSNMALVEGNLSKVKEYLTRSWHHGIVKAEWIQAAVTHAEEAKQHSQEVSEQYKATIPSEQWNRLFTQCQRIWLMLQLFDLDYVEGRNEGRGKG